MQLRVFADDGGGLHLEISSPALIYNRRLFVPMLAPTVPLPPNVDSRTMVEVWHESVPHKVPYLLIHSEETLLKNWRVIGAIEESDSRNVLNHVLDILAWD